MSKVDLRLFRNETELRSLENRLHKQVAACSGFQKLALERAIWHCKELQQLLDFAKSAPGGAEELGGGRADS